MAKGYKEFLLNNNGVAVLDGGATLEFVNIKPGDAQFVEIQQQNVVAIARLFGISASDLLAEMGGTSMTYQNIEQANMNFLQKTLARYMGEIENALSDLLPRGQKVQFKETALLRMDTKTLTEVRKTQIDAGIRSADEIRAEDGLDPLPKPKPAPAPVAPTPTPDSEDPSV